METLVFLEWEEKNGLEKNYEISLNLQLFSTSHRRSESFALRKFFFLFEELVARYDDEGNPTFSHIFWKPKTVRKSDFFL